MTSATALLALNAGSSSLKGAAFALAPDGSLARTRTARVTAVNTGAAELHGSGAPRRLGDVDHASAARAVLEELAPGEERARVAAIGHRVVHGGARFVEPLELSSEAERQLEELRSFAPLHNPPALSAVRAAAEFAPRAVNVAVFDTAFFSGLPPEAREYALPERWRGASGLRRFGFHGLAHEYMTRAVHERGRARRLVTLQLGHGCSAAAIREGRPIDTSMGFSPLEGLVMATRPGDLDAGVLLELGRRGESWDALTRTLYRSSGLAGLSGVGSDVRELLVLERERHEGATLALAVFCRRIVKYVGAYAALLGGLDAIAFGGGIGEGSPELRARILAPLAWLGVELDTGANAANSANARLSTPSSAVAVESVQVDEEVLIAERVRDLRLGKPFDAARCAS